MTKYYVTLIKNYDEFDLLKTTDLEEAIKRAEYEVFFIERDCRKNEEVEIRVYANDIEDEDCTCFDYDTIEF